MATDTTQRSGMLLVSGTTQPGLTGPPEVLAPLLGHGVKIVARARGPVPTPNAKDHPSATGDGW